MNTITTNIILDIESRGILQTVEVTNQDAVCHVVRLEHHLELHHSQTVDAGIEPRAASVRVANGICTVTVVPSIDVG